MLEWQDIFWINCYFSAYNYVTKFPEYQSGSESRIVRLIGIDFCTRVLGLCHQPTDYRL